MLNRSNDEFWNLTQREIEACIRAYIIAEHDIPSRWFGTIAATAWNAQRADRKRRQSFLNWRDFLPPIISHRKRGQTLEEMQFQAKQDIKMFYRIQ